MRPRFPKTDTSYYPIGGGLDLVTSAITKPPGRCIDAQNYEPDPVNGNRRINGYERFDGRTSPSSASYWVITATITSTINVNDTLTGLTSGASGKVLAVSGSTVVLGRVTGTYQLGESLQVGGVTKATSTSTAAENGATDPEDHADYRLLAANDRRADITTVPGSGQIRGVFVLNDTCYAMRDNAGATAGDLYKQTTGGWVQVTFGREIQFTGATGEVSAGDTITGATSGATATVVRSMLRTGTWTSSGVGTLILSGVTGTFQNGENVQVGGVTKVIANGADSAITRVPGGRVEATLGNFGGTAATKRIYGVDGANKAFEFDGTNYIPIRTGMTTDTPTHVAFHKSRLWLSFDASLQYSGANQPYSWTLLTGAGEIGMGDSITGIIPQVGTSAGASLLVAIKDSYAILYGSSSSDFNLIPSGSELGYAAYTMQVVGNDTYGYTANGVQAMITTLNYGDFEFAALSVLVQPLIARKRTLGVTPTASVALKAKNQYRLYFSDNSVLVFGLTGAKVNGILPLDYGLVVRCMWNAKLSTDEEVTYFGSDDGYIYKDNTGTSFDGDDIEAWMRPAFNNLQSPQLRKDFRRAVFEVTSEGYASVNITYDLGYGNPNVDPAAVQQDTTLIGAGGYWDQFNWDQFTWDAGVVTNAQMSIDGTETNINFLAYSSSAKDDPHVFQGVTLMFTPRRLARGGS